MPQPASNPTFLSRDSFIQYLDNYVSTFYISPHHCHFIESASYVYSLKKWHIEAKKTLSMDNGVYFEGFSGAAKK